LVGRTVVLKDAQMADLMDDLWAVPMADLLVGRTAEMKDYR